MERLKKYIGTLPQKVQEYIETERGFFRLCKNSEYDNGEVSGYLDALGDLGTIERCMKAPLRRYMKNGDEIDVTTAMERSIIKDALAKHGIKEGD